MGKFKQRSVDIKGKDVEKRTERRLAPVMQELFCPTVIRTINVSFLARVKAPNSRLYHFTYWPLMSGKMDDEPPLPKPAKPRLFHSGPKSVQL